MKIKNCCEELKWFKERGHIGILCEKPIIAFNGYIGIFMTPKYCPFCGKKIRVIK